MLNEELLENVTGTLDIKLKKGKRQFISEALINECAEPSARIKSMKLELQMYNRDSEENFRDLTVSELDAIVLDEDNIILYDYLSKEKTKHSFAGPITLRDLQTAIELHEEQVRSKTEWFGGVDIHHIFFEGLTLLDDGSYNVSWGS